MRLSKRGGRSSSKRPGLSGSGRYEAERGLIFGNRSPAEHNKMTVRRAGLSLQRSAGLPLTLPAIYQPRRHGRLLQRFVLGASAALIVAATGFGVSALAARPVLSQGQQVCLDGRPLCIAPSTSAVEQALQHIQDDLKTSYGMEVTRPEALTFVSVSCESRYICSQADVERALKDNMDLKVLATVIMVNDRPAVALKSDGEAQQALDAVLAPYKSSSAERTGVGFVENVQARQMPIDYSLVQPLDAAVRTLTLGAGVEDNLYTVKKGDSLAKIAKNFSLKVSDLRKANPALTSLVIQPGQTLNAVRPANWVNVRYTETVTRQEALPYETVEQTSASMYTTQKDIKQAGKNGQREVVAKVTYINGMEAEKEILSQTVLEAATNQIVVRGTKAVPKNNGSSGESGSSLKFVFPLKSYTLTSTFKKRTLEGVTRWHYGVDLAAPKGTPIYASRSGTVSYAGSASGYGLLVMIDHGGGYQTRYGHCSKLLVKKGEKVNKGQIIALVGSTGHSTGPHCHFEIRINGTPVDPQKYD